MGTHKSDHNVETARTKSHQGTGFFMYRYNK